jgi:hypothetical protein
LIALTILKRYTQGDSALTPEKVTVQYSKPDNDVNFQVFRGGSDDHQPAGCCNDPNGCKTLAGSPGRPGRRDGGIDARLLASLRWNDSIPKPGDICTCFFLTPDVCRLGGD